MNALHQKAIELKYEGKTYREIAAILGGEFTEGTLKNYFSLTGLLYTHYNAYESSQNAFRSNQLKSLFIRESAKMATIILDTFSYIVEYADKQEDEKVKIEYRLKATELAQKIIDRNILSKLKNEPVTTRASLRTLSDEEFTELLISQGLDPVTGLPLEKDLFSDTTEY